MCQAVDSLMSVGLNRLIIREFPSIGLMIYSFDILMLTPQIVLSPFVPATVSGVE